MVGQVLLRPEPVDKPEHLHLSNARKLSNQRGTPQNDCMDRRKFTKGALVTTAALSLGGMLGSFADDSKSDKGDKNKMKIPIRLYKTPW